MIKKIVVSVAIAIGVLSLTASARATSPRPPEANLTVSPATVSWPSSPDFQYRLTVRSGGAQADFSFRFPRVAWGPADVGGTPFSASPAKLEGPGELEATGVTIADPSPTACYRGAFPTVDQTYRLVLPPDTETVVTMDSSLTAMPVEGMDSLVSAEILSPDGPDRSLFTAPVGITGPYGVRILGGITGADPSRPTVLRPGGPFRLTGETVPAQKNTLLSFRAEPRMQAGGKPLLPRVITKVRTDGKGRFRTAPLRLRGEAVWVLTGKVSGSSQASASCVEDLSIDDGLRPATTADVDERAFVSTSIKGPGAKPDKITVRFTNGVPIEDSDDPDAAEVPVIVTSGGCNAVTGTYRLREGRLRWLDDGYQTLVGCTPDRDQWLIRRMKKGINASMQGRRLILHGRGIRVQLKPRG